MLFARSEEKLAATAEAIAAETGNRPLYTVGDLTDAASVQGVIDRTVAEFGGLWALFNNTGGPPAGPIADASPDAFLTAFRAHLINNQLLAQAVIPGMKEAGYGRIVNIVSTSVREPIAGLGVSNTTRAAVAGCRFGGGTLSHALGPLRAMREEGLITDSEYESKRAEIVARM
jgi:3-oxoacyl-[acyl-carrier protein] reductase